MTSKWYKGLMGLSCVALVSMVAASVVALAGDPPKEDEKKTPTVAKVGSAAPDFVLKDTDGKSHRLSDYTSKGKIVVLEWFNSGCPFIKLHHEKQTTVADLHKDFKDKDVVILAVNSTNSSHPDFGKDAEAKKKWKMETPILIDADGKTGHAYGAKTTPHLFVIDKKGILAYAGAMDNDPRNEKSVKGEPGKEKINYVRNALNELIAGKKVTMPETKPYGCGVKY